MIQIGNQAYQTPYRNLLPPLTEEEASTLKEDIEQRGIVIPVVIDEQYNVIDGHNRLRIAAELGLTDVPFDIRVGLSEAEKSQLAQDLNLHRRHLDKEKRQALVTRLRQDGLSYPQIAEKLQISPMTAYRDYNSTLSNDKVESPTRITGKDGKERPATMPKTSVIARNAKEAAQAIKVIEGTPIPLPETTLTLDDVRREKRKAEAVSIAQAATKNAEQNKGSYLVEGCNVVIGDARKLDLSQFSDRYGVIVADPPWPYRVTKGQGTTDGQYETMTDEQLRAMPVNELAADSCVLLLWGTWPKLPEALALMAAWGFEYVTGFPWVKTTNDGVIEYGVGYWVRGASEYVLVGKRGNVSPPRQEGFMGLLSPNLKHSRKPKSVHQIAEALPGPYLELFARESVYGWTVFGNDLALSQKVFA